MGQLVREYPLTAEEIKMIFGFLWPKANKVRGDTVIALGVHVPMCCASVVVRGNRG
jgi:hypothetical protein